MLHKSAEEQAIARLIAIRDDLGGLFDQLADEWRAAEASYNELLATRNAVIEQIPEAEAAVRTAEDRLASTGIRELDSFLSSRVQSYDQAQLHLAQLQRQDLELLEAVNPDLIPKSSPFTKSDDPETLLQQAEALLADVTQLIVDIAAMATMPFYLKSPANDRHTKSSDPTAVVENLLAQIEQGFALIKELEPMAAKREGLALIGDDHDATLVAIDHLIDEAFETIAEAAAA